MASFAKITPIDMGERPNVATVKGANEIYTAAASNGNGGFGAYFSMTERTDKYLIALKNSGTTAATAAIKAGNSGKWGTTDLDISIDAGATAFVKIDSGRFKNETPNAAQQALANVDESLKGAVVITATAATVAAAVIKMPF